MTRQIVLDLSRLVFAAWRRTPAGIPRVELAYAQRLIETSPDNVDFVVLDALGRLRVIDRRSATTFVAAIAQFWHGKVHSDAAHCHLMLRALFLHIRALLSVRKGLAYFLHRYETPTLYIIVSQLHLERMTTFERLKNTGRLHLIYFIHDLIPCILPEYFPHGEEEKIRRRMTTAARLANTVIANSWDTANAFRSLFGNGARLPEIVVAPLGFNAVIAHEGTLPIAPRPYFVMVGTIEPRKNHLLILNLWRRLREEMDTRTPRLILIGGRGWENENIVDMLERSPSLRGTVEERDRLSDQEMTQILRNACALLIPSFAEGYGLPLADALALGVPALCSDLPALREVGKHVPEFFDPLDGLAWHAAIVDYAAERSPRRQAQIARLVNWQPQHWNDHFSTVAKHIKEFEISR